MSVAPRELLSELTAEEIETDYYLFLQTRRQ